MQAMGLGVVAVMAIAACSSGGSGNSGSSGDNSGSYQIAVNADLSGPFASTGVPVTAGVSAAVEQVNAAGGIDGHKVNLDIRDHGCQVDRATANAKQFVIAKDLAVLGETCTSVAPAEAAVLSPAKIPMLAVSVAANLLDSAAYPYVYQADASYADQAKAEIDQAVLLSKSGKLSGPLRVAALAYNTPASQSWSAAIKQDATAAGVRIVDSLTVQPTATSLAPQMATAAQSKANVIVALVSPDAVSQAVTALKSLNAQPYILNIDSTTTSSFAKQLNYPNFLTFGGYNLAALSTDSKYAATRKYISSYKGGDPGALFDLAGYASAQFVFEGLKQCGFPCSGAKLQAQLNHLSTDLNGLAYGTVGFSSSTHSSVHSGVFYQLNASTGAFAPVGAPIDLS
jgi:ABC-type branched-subunit amino acid transport system substrate-binding protein